MNNTKSSTSKTNNSDDRENPIIITVRNKMPNPQNVCSYELQSGETKDLRKSDFEQNPAYEKRVKRALDLKVLEQVS